MNYEAMWNELKRQIESDLKYHQGGIMQSIGESVHGAQKCEEVLYYMKDIEEQQKVCKDGIVGTYVGIPIVLNKDCAIELQKSCSMNCDKCICKECNKRFNCDGGNPTTGCDG